MDTRDFSGTSRFQVVRQLGMGGMGVVYEAIDLERGEKIALKTLRNVDSNAILLLKQEFRALGNLLHPNLIRLGELFESRGSWFFTMELIKGQELMPWLRGGDSARLRDTLTQLVTGLGALHDAGRVHRDVKPSNVLVANGRAVLLDFGLATRHDRGDQSSWTDAAVVGTPDYMAPEQATARPIGPEADWYSVGVILYEALTGRLPIEGRPLEVVMEKQRVVPPPPSHYVPDVPKDLDQLCSEMLEIDPAKRPSRGQILRRLGAPVRIDNTPTPRADTPSMTPPTQRQMFVGRESELELLKLALKASKSGEPVTILVEAESGMGKSALAEHFLDSLDRSEVVVLRGKCYERESVPYKAIDGVIDSLSRYMARLPDKEAASLLPFHISLLAEVFPVLRGVKVIVEQPRAPHVPDPQEQRRRVFAALRELLARLGNRHTVVLLIDDLHWADEDSFALLDAILHPPEAPRLLLVSTAWPRGHDDHPIQFGSDLRTMVLGPLGTPETERLARALFNAVRAPVTEPTLATVVRESHGHPMFVAELVRHAALRGDTGDADAVIRLDDVLAERIDALEPAERELLELVAIAGRPLALEMAGRALEVTPTSLVPLVGYLQSANLLRATGRGRRDQVEPYHDRIRRAVTARAEERKPYLHRRLAISFEAVADSPPMLVGVHWERAGEPARAASHYMRAGDLASEAFAFDRAVRLYERCIALDPDPSRELRIKLADALANAGRGREAADVYLAVAGETTIAAEKMELERKAAHQLLRGGHIDDGLVVLERLLAAVDIDLPKTPRSALAQLLWRRAKVRLRGTDFKPRDPSQVTREELARIDMCWSAACGLSMTDWIRGASFQTLNVLLSLQTGETFRARRALLLEAAHVAASHASARPRAERLVARATAGAELDDPYLRAWVDLSTAFIVYFSGEWRKAFELAERADATFGSNCTDVVWERDTAHALSHWVQVQLGSLKTLGQMLPLRLREAELQGNLFAECALPSSVAILHWAARDDLAGGRAAIGKILERWTLRGFQLQHWHETLSSTMLDLYEGDVMRARRRVEEGWIPLSKSLLTKMQVARFESRELQTRTAIAAARASEGSERERYLRIAEGFARKMGREKMPWMQAVTTLSRAGILSVRGDQDAAVGELRAALAASEAADLGLHIAASKVRLGELLGGDEGRALVEAGLESLRAEDVRKPERLVALFAP
jgi:eukaryotic-like serine/threonine-protein kinase